jgi:hypothetical protein
MILLISSDAAQRYSDDIVRTLAHPRGTELQFRYDLAHFDVALKSKAASDQLAGGTALIAYLAADATAQTAELTSVRLVTIKRTEVVGSSCILTLSADAYLHPLDDAGLRALLGMKGLASLPTWRGGSHPQGSYAIDGLKELAISQLATPPDDMKAFEETAAALGKYPQFAASSGLAFFAVRAVGAENPPRAAWWRRDPTPKLADNRYAMLSGYRYRLDVYTYRPAGSAITASSTKLVVSTDERAVQFTSSKEAVLDSRYDLNRFVFTTDQLLDPVPAAVRVALAITGGTPPGTEQRCDITLSIWFGGWRRRAFWRVFFIAAGTASSAIIGVAFKDNFSIWIAAMMCVGPLIAGYAGTIPLLRKNG